MERLERIKKETEFNHFNMPETGEFSLAFNLKKEDFDWLIEQVEMVQKIEFEIDNSDMGTAVDNIIKIIEG